MEACAFELVCDNCLETHGVLESDRLPSCCPSCGAFDPWVGPVLEAAPTPAEADDLQFSTFYLGAVSRRS